MEWLEFFRPLLKSLLLPPGGLILLLLLGLLLGRGWLGRSLIWVTIQTWVRKQMTGSIAF